MYSLTTIISNKAIINVERHISKHVKTDWTQSSDLNSTLLLVFYNTMLYLISVRESIKHRKAPYQL